MKVTHRQRVVIMDQWNSEEIKKEIKKIYILNKQKYIITGIYKKISIV